MRFGQKAQKKPLALLKALVALGGEQVHVAQVTDALWPDSGGDQAYSAFTTTLARLRKLIGRDALVLADARLTLAEPACWVDARALAASFDAARRAADARDDEEAWRRAEEALGLYRGPFLAGEFEPLEIPAARKRLHGLLMRHVEQLGAFFADAGHAPRAIELYQRALEIDPLAEALCRRLMLCLHRCRRGAEARAAYERCREALKASLGAEPSAETERVHRELGASSTSPAAAPEAQPSIAVLRFAPLGDEPEQAHLADGLVEDIITGLSRFSWFHVIARSTTFTYGADAPDLRRIAGELGVRYVMTGSVRRLGERVRVTAQLVEATGGNEIWAERYDAELARLFEMQDEIVARVVGAMNPELYGAEVRRARQQPAEGLDVWTLAARGRWHATRATQEDNAEAQRLLGRALELDPDRALTLAFLAVCHVCAVFFGWSASPPQSLQEARRLAHKALTLDENDAWVQCAMGMTEFLSRELDKAIAHYQRAIELNPNFALGHGYRGLALAYAGEPRQAIEAAQRALRLSPRDPELLHFYIALGTAHFVAEDYGEAARCAELAIAARDVPSGYRLLAASRALLGEAPAARAAMAELLRLRPSTTVSAVRTVIHFKRPDDLERYLRGLVAAGLPA